MSDVACYIYIIANANGKKLSAPVKVGISSTPLKRLAALQTANPRKLVLLATFGVPSRDIAKAIETAFHHVKADRRLAGEWFDIEPMLAVELMCLNMRAAFNHLLEDEAIRNLAADISGLQANEEKLAKWRAHATSHTNDNIGAKCQ